MLNTAQVTVGLTAVDLTPSGFNTDQEYELIVLLSQNISTNVFVGNSSVTTSDGLRLEAPASPKAGWYGAYGYNFKLFPGDRLYAVASSTVAGVSVLAHSI